jgi:hypothetical protein
MNAPVNVGKKGLLDWGEIYSEKDEWEKTKSEVNLSNQAFRDNAELEVERISDMLEDEFDDHFYIHHPKNNHIKCGWTWYIVPHGKTWTESLFSIDMIYADDCVCNASRTHTIYSLKSIHFKSNKCSASYTSIEEIFKVVSIINLIKSYINK